MDSDNYLKWVYIYLKGFAMGSADAVPGVSGGTIALITGIYGRLISAITSINIRKMLVIVQGIKPSEFKKALDNFRELDGFFLLILGAGLLSAIVLVLNVVHYLLSSYTVPTFGFFWGLIAVSSVVLYRQVDLTANGAKTAFFLGFVIAFLVSGVASNSLGHSLPIVFLAGALSLSAMILPGISGSLILILLGQYEFMSGSLSRFTDAAVSTLTTGDTTSLVIKAQPIVTFLIGGVFGLFTISHLVNWALENHREITFAFLVSLVLGALRAPILEVEKEMVETGSSWIQVMPEFFLMALVGGVIVLIIDSKAGMIKV